MIATINLTRCLVPWLLLVYRVTSPVSGADTTEEGRSNADCDISDCENLKATCLECAFPTCSYGAIVQADCQVIAGAVCRGKQIKKETKCQFCYQTHSDTHICRPVFNCSATTPPPNNLVPTTCQVNDTVICIGNRKFTKRVPCNWTSGYKWSTALLLSITLGGFGVDRFYLGLWRSGLGKLFSFGGFGVWTIIDVILIAVGYIGPSDGSLYMY